MLGQKDREPRHVISVHPAVQDMSAMQSHCKQLNSNYQRQDKQEAFNRQREK